MVNVMIFFSITITVFSELYFIFLLVTMTKVSNSMHFKTHAGRVKKTTFKSVVKFVIRSVLACK